jgi:hypothetical protein
MHSPAKPIAPVNVPPRSRSASVSGLQIAVLFGAFTLLISIPIWTHPVPPLSDYVNHLARMQVIATLAKNPQLAQFYEINWQVIPNLTMDIIVPPIARVMNIYLAGQAFIVAMFALIISGILVLNRALIGRWSVLPLFAIPLLYNWIFLIGLMNYIFGIGVALWALAGWVAARERRWPLRFVLSTLCVVVLFFCHLSALGIYAIGILSFEMFRLWTRRAESWPGRIAEFVASGLPFLAVAPLLYASPTMNLVSDISWDQRGKLDGVMFIFSDYTDIAAFALMAIMAASAIWAVRHRVLQFHPWVLVLLVVGGAVYFALPRVMFDTYMADQRVPVGIAFMAFACGELDVRHRLVWRGFLTTLVILTAGRVLELVAAVGFDQRIPRLGTSHRPRFESVRRLRQCLRRRRRARSRACPCGHDRDHRAILIGHDVVHRAGQADRACPSRLSRICRLARRHAALDGPAHSGRGASVAEHAGILAQLDEIRLHLHSLHGRRPAQSGPDATKTGRGWRPLPALPHHQARIAAAYCY